MTRNREDQRSDASRRLIPARSPPSHLQQCRAQVFRHQPGDDAVFHDDDGGASQRIFQAVSRIQERLGDRLLPEKLHLQRDVVEALPKAPLDDSPAELGDDQDGCDRRGQLSGGAPP